jgi:hypothetical protein
MAGSARSERAVARSVFLGYLPRKRMECPRESLPHLDDRPITLVDQQDADQRQIGTPLMKIIPGTVALSLSLAITSLTSALAASLTCESTDGNWQGCAMDTRGGATLLRRLSRAGCWQGDTWGNDRNCFWVNRNCRAVFHLGDKNLANGLSDRHEDAPVPDVLGRGVREHPVVHPEYHRGVDPRTHDDGTDTTARGLRNGRNFSCASTGSGVTWCRQAVDRSNEVEIRRQLSRSACTYGHSWGVELADVWVSHGCHAEFVIY